MKNGRINLIRMSRRKKITGMVLLVAILGVFVGGIFLSQTKPSEKNYYGSRINAIGISVGSIKDDLGDRDALINPELLSVYYGQLDKIIDNCSDIIKQSPTVTTRLKDKTEKTAKLCQDLLSVASYQKNLYGQLEVLLTIQTLKLPQPTDENALNAVRNISANIAQVQSNLKRINNPRFTDPALDEINTQLSRLQDQTKQLQATQPLDPASYNRFLKSIDEVQTDLLIRRAYYWNNTVEIESLARVIEKQAELYR